MLVLKSYRCRTAVVTIKGAWPCRSVVVAQLGEGCGTVVARSYLGRELSWCGRIAVVVQSGQQHYN